MEIYRKERERERDRNGYVSRSSRMRGPYPWWSFWVMMCLHVTVWIFFFFFGKIKKNE